MRRRIRALLILLTLGGVVFVVAVIFTGREPKYRGRALSEWLHDLDYGRPDFKTTQEGIRAAETAITEMGQAALPKLRAMMRARDSKFRLALKRIASRQRLVRFRWRPSAENLQWRGARGVGILGVKGKEAIPDLLPLLASPTPWVRGRAVTTLASLGSDKPDLMSLVVARLEDSDADVRNCACIALQRFGRTAAPAVPALVQHATNNTSVETRSIALGARPHLMDDREVLMAFIADRLKDSNARIRGIAALSLGNMGPVAHGYLTNLEVLLADTDKDVRRAATNAIRNITGTERVEKDEPFGSIKLVNIPLLQVLELYKQIRGVEVEVASEVFRRNPPVTIQPIGTLGKRELLAIFEEEIAQQANARFRTLEDGKLRLEPISK